MKKHLAVVGLGFGDEGKGTIVEFVSSLLQASIVVRFNGGPQAAHHVVVPDGMWHCYSQFGSGTLVGAATHFSSPTIFKPHNFLRERERLLDNFGSDPIGRFSVSPDTALVTALDAIRVQISETVRGKGRHGSVGMGVGLVEEARRVDPDSVLYVRDLLDPQILRDKIEGACHALAPTLADALFGPAAPLVRRFMERVSPESLIAEHLEFLEVGAGAIRPDAEILSTVNGSIVFEGAQGMLLDREFGFRPHITKSDVSFRAVDQLAHRIGIGDDEVYHLGVLRSYATRHGAGPFPTEGAHDAIVARELHNPDGEWQGPFRTGVFDLVLARYALEVAGRVDALAVTHLDLVGEHFPVCGEYRYLGTEELQGRVEYERRGDAVVVTRIIPQDTRSGNEDLTRILKECVPLELRDVTGNAVGREAAALFLETVERELGRPVKVLSFGPTISDKEHRW